MNKIQQEDIKDFAKSFALSGDLKDSSVLITGGTGLIGSNLIFCLLALDVNVRIIAPVRNMTKASEIFGEFSSKINMIECDILSYNYDSLGDIDYVIHCAAPTSSLYFVEKPVETSYVITEGTRILLEYACSHKVKGFVFLSSLEVYGECKDDKVTIEEDFQGYLNPLKARSSYPMAKRAAENLCYLYYSEYSVPVKIARLAQVTGAGIADDDNRVVGQFARLVSKNNDIVLYTKGESARPYLYTTDCVAAIMYILLKGNSGEAYNAANEQTYISAHDLAVYFRDNFNPSINVIVELDESKGYPPATKLRLSSKKLGSLGWKPTYRLKDILTRLISSIQYDSKA